MLADKSVDLVSICLPNHLHAPVAIDCLNAGKHVLCEKPAAINFAQAQKMKEAADKNGKILNIGVCNRFNEAVVRIKDTIESGALGELYQIYCSFRAFRSIPALGGWFTTKELSGGGALIDWGVHFLDLINYCAGDIELKTISAVCHSELAVNMGDYVYRSMHAGPPKLDGVYDVEEYVTGLIRTSGPALTFSGAWAQNIDEDAMLSSSWALRAVSSSNTADTIRSIQPKTGSLCQKRRSLRFRTCLSVKSPRLRTARKKMRRYVQI